MKAKQDKLKFGNEGLLTKRQPNPEQSELDQALSRVEEIEKQALDNLNDKVRAGKTLTASELKTLKELQANLEARKHAGLEVPEIVPRAIDVAKYFNRSVRSVRYWFSKGAPRGTHGYNLSQISEWAIKQGLIKGTVRDSDNPDTEDKLDLEKQLLKKNIELKEHRLQIERGLYIFRSEVDLEFAGKLAILISGLDFMTHERAFEWAELILNGDPEDAPQRLREAIKLRLDEKFNEMAKGVYSVTFGPEEPPSE